MEFSHSVQIKATPQTIFNIYADVNNWSIWDKDVELSSIEGEFKTGAIGELKPKGAPKSKIFFTEVIKDKSFTTLGKLPLCKMYFEHTINIKDENTTTVTHTIKFFGFLSPIFGRLIGNGIKKNLPDVLEGLKIQAVANKSLEKEQVRTADNSSF
ncbi:MAG TPA: polyketide cyclase [Bacteroidetes bacterium]|jgi:hypothetical protein|nr:polyketide cyclase [Arcobacter sp.]HHH54028.1 polyketide cyclase [Bacteroidota bacterium]